MSNAVSGSPGLTRIQTTPEIDQEKPGALGSARPKPRRATSYRTWPVFSVALLALLGLMLVPALTALRRSEAIYDDVALSQVQFQDSQRVLEALSDDVFAMSITIRDFLLDNSADAGRSYRLRFDSARDQLQSNIERLSHLLPPDGQPSLATLSGQVTDYVAAVQPVFDWTARQRIERSAYFLRQEQRPRRETILAVAQQLSTLSSSIYAEQQRRTNASELRFRRELTQSVWFALLAGVVVSTGGMLRMRWLERRAAEARTRAEDTTAEIRKLSSQLRRAQEEERRTISRELHDEVGQKLTAMRMELGTLDHLRSGHEGEFQSRLSEVKELAEQSLHIIRDIAAGLRPSVLDDLGLPAAVKKQAREFSQRTGIGVSVDVEGLFDTLRDPQRTYVYRILQEALTNCAKHSYAKSVRISIVDRDQDLELTVVDDGVGFDPFKVGLSGLGLIGMEERVRELGGTLTIQARTGGGTSIRALIPR
jgi:signal transduction histidine kinase